MLKNYLRFFFPVFLFLGAVNAQPVHHSTWSNIDRTWIGPEYWANRLQDWQLRDGKLHCVNDRNPMRTLHLLTGRMDRERGTVEMEVPLHLSNQMQEGASVGFLIGAGAHDLDYRAAALIHLGTGRDGGYYVGINHQKKLFVRSHQENTPAELVSGAPVKVAESFRLKVTVQQNGNLKLTVLPINSGQPLGEIEAKLPLGVSGNLALVSHKVKAAFGEWKVGGSKLTWDETHIAGPILSSQYTLSENQLNLTAQFMPLGLKDNRIVLLQRKAGDEWTDIASADVNAPAYVAVFKVKNWDTTNPHAYRLAYKLVQRDASEKLYYWGGTIVHNPVNKSVITVAGFTGNHNTRHGFGNDSYAFDLNHIWFPHTDIVNHVSKQKPDLLFFSGDQVYEGQSPTGVDQDNLQLDYLYKWYLWCWAYRSLTKDVPCISIPDDHDVYQGNLWGEGGRKTDKDDKGGYVHPAEFVRMVEQTQTSNLPDPADSRPIEQGIGSYFTNLKYGGIGLAVIEDRKFKSGCNGRIVGAASGRADHINNPEYDILRADSPGLHLLGERQEQFLEAWTSDWKDEEMKIVLSQTIFANMATHHGGNLFRLLADLDSNGWPQSGRNRALEAIRKGYAFMLAGDQHLASLVHHGIDEHYDAGFSFAVPSIANFYPRGWKPEAEGQNREPREAAHLGEHRDGLLNLVRVYAVTNPPSLTGVSTGVEPLALHDRTPGYGIVKMDKSKRTYEVECWPRSVDPAAPNAQQYEGWPKTISQMDNYGRKAVAFLPEIQVDGMTDPVVKVVNESSKKVVYTLRINGQTFQPKVFARGKYTLYVGEPNTDTWQVFESVEAGEKGRSEKLTITFIQK